MTLVELAEHILIREDADAAEVVQNELIRDGVELALNAKSIIEVSEENGMKKVRYQCGQKNSECEVISRRCSLP